MCAAVADDMSYAGLVAFWYGSNILVMLSNKFLLSNYGFKYPVFLTGCHMLACTVWGCVYSMVGATPRQHIRSRLQLFKIAVLACIFCSSIISGNIALRYIPISFDQAIGATTPVFTAFLAYAILKDTESTHVYTSLVPVVLGIIIATGAEPSFEILGFLAAIGATCGRALKSILQGLLLADSSEKMNSMSLLLYMAPLATCLIIPVIAIAEPDVLHVLQQSGSSDKRFLPALAVNSTLAFFVNLSNFAITKRTSALTLQVLGNAKGVIAAVVSVLVFRNPATWQGAVGYGIAIVGVSLYSHIKKGSRQMSLNEVSSHSSKTTLLPVSILTAKSLEQPQSQTQSRAAVSL